MLKKFLFEAASIFFWIIRKVNKTIGGNYSKNVVIIAVHKIGDSVFTLPAINLIIEKHTGYKITLFTYELTKVIFESRFPEIEFVTVNDSDFGIKRRWIKSFYRKMISKLNPEYVYDITGNARSFSFIFNAKAKIIHGIAIKYNKRVFDYSIQNSSRKYLMERYIAAVDPNWQKFEYNLVFPLDENRDNTVVLIPFGGWEAKKWGFDNFVKLTNLLKKDFNCILAFQKGLVEQNVVKQLVKSGIRIRETASIKDLMSFIKGKGVCIGNDSGPLYIAVMCGLPTLGIYGPTNPEFSVPKGEWHSYINKTIHCSPKPGNQYCHTDAGRKGCPSFECMKQLAVSDVYKKSKEFLDQNGIKPLQNEK